MSHSHLANSVKAQMTHIQLQNIQKKETEKGQGHQSGIKSTDPKTLPLNHF